MKISKKEALALTKVLHQHVEPAHAIVYGNVVDDHRKTLRELAGRIDRFILVDEADGDYVDEEYRPKESADKQQACDFFPEGEDEEGAKDELSPEPTAFVTGDGLHDLKPATSKSGHLEFEKVGPSVDLLVDGEPVVGGIAYVRRTGRQIVVEDVHGDQTIYEVSRFPKGWATLMPAGALVEVGN